MAELISDTAIDRALHDGNLIELMRLAELGLDIRGVDDSSLITAATLGHEPIVRYLDWALGADVRACDDECVREASARGRAAVVRYAVERGADIHACDGQCMRWAAKGGHGAVVRYLVSVGADIREGERMHGIIMPCLYADNYDIRPAGSGYGAVVRYLVSVGADLIPAALRRAPGGRRKATEWYLIVTRAVDNLLDIELLIAHSPPVTSQIAIAHYLSERGVISFGDAPNSAEYAFSFSKQYVAFAKRDAGRRRRAARRLYFAWVPRCYDRRRRAGRRAARRNLRDFRLLANI